MEYVALQEIINEYGLKVLTTNIDLSDKVIKTPKINRPALQLAGFFDYFEADRLQLIGFVEQAYLERLDPEAQDEALRKIFEYNIPGVVICRSIEPVPQMIRFAEEKDIPVLQCSLNTTEFMSEIIRWLKVRLAEQITLHGVLVDIFGEGVLIMGESGIGKSETALELIQRGHRLVADDAVEIRRASRQTLIGSSPDLIRYLIELRGIGILDVRQLFGVQSVKTTQSIDLVIQLEVWDYNKEYERLGINDEYMNILGNDIVCHTIPIRPGRNLAIICESAAINHRQKKMGYNAGAQYNRRRTDSIWKTNVVT